MTTCFVQAAGTIELYFYGELDEQSRVETERHLSSCADCRRALDELRDIQRALATLPVVDAPPGGDWTPFMARLAAAVHLAHAGSTPGAAPGGRTRRAPQLAAYVAMAALLALVTMSVAYVVRSRSIVGPGSPVVADAGADSGSDGRPWTADAAFAALSEQHFERSKLVVLGLASKEAAGLPAGEWEYERELASTLLNDTRLYRLAAEQRGMTALSKIMSDLELVLLQASISNDPDPATLGQIQSLIRKRDLVTRMNAVAFAGM